MHEPTKGLTDLIRRASDNDDRAKETLYAQVYDNLRDAAHRLLSKQHRRDLQTTDLVNEVALRFETKNALKSMANRRVFFAVAIRAMNQILVDQYRRRSKLVDSLDRSGEPLDEVVNTIEHQVGADFERLQTVLVTLEAEAPRQHAVIMHRFFGGLSIRDTAELLDVSEQTVERDWRLARAKLFARLKGNE